MFFDAKKFYFKALSLSLASMMSVSSVANATCLKSTDSQASLASDTKPDKKESKLSEWVKKHWIISGGAVGISAVFGAIALKKLAKLGISTALFYGNCYVAKATERQMYDAKPSKFTKRQAGASWCWLGCLQGLYKYNNFEISQEDIFKAIFGVSPKRFTASRNEGYTLTALQPPVIDARINSINPYLKFHRALIYANKNKDSGPVAIKNNILDYYNSIGKSAFAITDNAFPMVTTSGKVLGHVSNVIEISDNKITIEDPETALSRTEDLDTFCKRYYDSDIIDTYPVILMYTVVSSKLNLAAETHYYGNQKFLY